MFDQLLSPEIKRLIVAVAVMDAHIVCAINRVKEQLDQVSSDRMGWVAHWQGRSRLHLLINLVNKSRLG